MIDVVMPQLGESIDEATVSKWFVREGQYVTRDQVLLEVENVQGRHRDPLADEWCHHFHRRPARDGAP
ncbi:biotin/lipoyl-containing protein [Nannocystis pusilla]|uniref:biotin/lipoyl-containing protein n=1 Tax=Nannocystis pusilla TaxID=889268 RepID=UPI003DA32A04